MILIAADERASRQGWCKKAKRDKAQAVLEMSWAESRIRGRAAEDIEDIKGWWKNLRGAIDHAVLDISCEQNEVISGRADAASESIRGMFTHRRRANAHAKFDKLRALPLWP